MLKCKKCEIEKLEVDFYFRNKKENKRHSVCKVCSEQNRKSKEHYEQYKDEYIARNRIRQERLLNENRQNLSNYVSDKACVDCGESDPIVLEFDHLKPEEKKYGISKMMCDYKWSQILDEINKCELVCANCHKRRTAKQFGWWKG